MQASRIIVLFMAAMVIIPGCSKPDRKMVAPDFELKALDDSTVRLSDLKGHPVLISFWGMACPPCHEEAPHLSRLSEKYREQGLVVLAINVQNDTKDRVSQFVKKGHLQQKMLMFGGEAASKYGVYGIPVTVWIDREGMIADKESGFPGASVLDKKTHELVYDK